MTEQPLTIRAAAAWGVFFKTLGDFFITHAS